MSAASISLAFDGAAAANITDGANQRINPGASVTVALQSSTGIRRWIIREDNTDNLVLDGFYVQIEAGTGAFSTSFTMPRATCLLPLLSETWDGYNWVQARVIIQGFPAAVGQYHRAEVANTSNVNTANMNVVVDGVTLTQGQYLLLVGQTTVAQNGVYVVGTVTASFAPLTRAPDLDTSVVVPSPQYVEVQQGTSFSGQWKTSNTGNLTVGTTSVVYYPKVVRGSANLASNTVNVTTLWIQTGATFVAVATNLNATAQVSTVTAGAGTGNIIIQGANAGGTGSYSYLGINY